MNTSRYSLCIAGIPYSLTLDMIKEILDFSVLFILLLLSFGLIDDTP